MQIADLDSEVLTARLGELLGQERQVQVEFLLHLEEFDRRRQYEAKGYASLWEFCRRELGLLDGAIYRRTHAMRIVRNFPEAADYLRDGRLFMTTLVLLKDVLTRDNAKDLFERASRKSKNDVEAIVAELKPGQAIPPTRISKLPAAEGRTRVRMTVSREFMAAFEEAKVILSHSIPSGDFESILRRGLDAIIERAGKRNGTVETRRRKKEPANSAARTPDEAEPPNAKAHSEVPIRDVGSLNSAKRVAIPADVRRQIWARDGGRCVWPIVSGGDGGVCGSRRQLEIDHVVPFAKGGKSDASNLRLCCRDHNALHARREFGESWMARFRMRSRLPLEEV
jgi:5-methylcytosine-specific restriction endonuclease McrA